MARFSRLTAPMPDSPHDPLPKGANGLNLGEPVLAFARDKLVFTPKGSLAAILTVPRCSRRQGLRVLSRACI
jgi:hypothetical protein